MNEVWIETNLNRAEPKLNHNSMGIWNRRRESLYLKCELCCKMNHVWEDSWNECEGCIVFECVIKYVICVISNNIIVVMILMLKDVYVIYIWIYDYVCKCLKLDIKVLYCISCVHVNCNDWLSPILWFKEFVVHCLSVIFCSI